MLHPGRDPGFSAGPGLRQGGRTAGLRTDLLVARPGQLGALPGGPLVWVLLGTPAIDTAPGGDQAALRDQHRHLLALSADGLVKLQLVPGYVPAAEVPAHSFALIRYRAPGLADQVLINPASTPCCRDIRPDAGQAYLKQFFRLALGASAPDDTVQALAGAVL